MILHGLIFLFEYFNNKLSHFSCQFYRKYGIREDYQYSEILALCRFCCCLFWPSAGRLCIYFESECCFDIDWNGNDKFYSFFRPSMHSGSIARLSGSFKRGSWRWYECHKRVSARSTSTIPQIFLTLNHSGKIKFTALNQKILNWVQLKEEIIEFSRSRQIIHKNPKNCFIFLWKKIQQNNWKFGLISFDFTIIDIRILLKIFKIKTNVSLQNEKFLFYHDYDAFFFCLKCITYCLVMNIYMILIILFITKHDMI